MEFYDFRLKYIETDKKLRDMLAEKTGPKAAASIKTEAEVIIDTDDDWDDDAPDADQPPELGPLEAFGDPNWRWKCTTCFATFEKRKLLRQHRRVHMTGKKIPKTEKKDVKPDVSFDQVWIDENSLQNSILPDDIDVDLVQAIKKAKPNVTPTKALLSAGIDPELRWECKACSARFRTRQLLYDHRKTQKEHCFMQSLSLPAASFPNDVMDTSASGLIECETIIDSGSDNEEKAILNNAMDTETSVLNKSMGLAKATLNKVVESKTLTLNKSLGSDELRWTCKKCPKRFATRILLREHMREHRVDFESKKNALIKSIQEKNIVETTAPADTPSLEDDDDYAMPDWLQPSGSTKVDRWKCKRCSLSFETRRLLQNHNASHRMKVETDDYVTLNNVDQEGNGNSDDPTAGHLDADHKQSKIESKTEIIDANAIQNVSPSQETNGLRWKCSNCNEVFQCRRFLRLHRKVHQDEPRNYPLQRKPKTTSETRKSKNTDPTQWQCNICGQLFEKRLLLRAHRRQDHNIDRHNYTQFLNHELKAYEWSSEYICDICGKRVITKRGIRKHMIDHGADEIRPARKHLCTVCGIWLSSGHNLNIHDKVVHKQERDFPCPHCDRSFSFAHHLRAHINRHTGYRPHTCQTCNKNFFELSNLNEHIKSVHLNVKRYICSICSKTFSRSGNLSAHMFTHTNQYPHQCVYCHAGFLRKYKLTAHLLLCQSSAINST